MKRRSFARKTRDILSFRLCDDECVVCRRDEFELTNERCCVLYYDRSETWRVQTSIHQCRTLRLDWANRQIHYVALALLFSDLHNARTNRTVVYTSNLCWYTNRVHTYTRSERDMQSHYMLTQTARENARWYAIGNTHTCTFTQTNRVLHNPTGCVLYCADAASCCTRLYFTIDCTCNSGSAATYIHLYAIWTVVNMIFLLSLLLPLLLLSCENILHNFFPMWKESSILSYILYRNFGMNGALISYHQKLLDFRIWANPFHFFFSLSSPTGLPFPNWWRSKYITNLLDFCLIQIQLSIYFNIFQIK